MVLTQLDPKGLASLRSSEQLKLLNSIDSLRSHGIDHYISLPQIIVCGDQSSGKSSVLEAISGISFPVKSSLCTRFPTELVLRKSASADVKVSIIAHQSRTEADRAALSNFHRRLDGSEDLPALIENAKTAMGLLPVRDAFPKDLLRIEITGPDRPHLTIVDLPGLIHSENKHQSASDVDLIKDVVRSYMQEPRSIILAVVSAKNDYANQIVLRLARSADPRGRRTLGVITKPDTLLPGSDSEEAYVSLAGNGDVQFHFGWHVLKNMDSETGLGTLADRDEEEAEFFRGGAWASLPRSSLGIQSLREKLSGLLLHQIIAKLPNLAREIRVKSALCQKQLDSLGQPRTTLEEQRLYLFQTSQSFQTLAKASLEGTYSGAFFEDPTSTSGHQKRFRAVIQRLNREFAMKLSCHGQRYDLSTSSGNKGIAQSSAALPRDQFIEIVVKLMEQSCGRELPGMFNPMIVADLFKEQSTPWKDITFSHIEKVWRAAQDFLKHLTIHVCDSTTVKKVQETIVKPKLKAILASMRDTATELLNPHLEGHPITYNRSFPETLQKVRSTRLKSELISTMRRFFSSNFPSSFPDPGSYGSRSVNPMDLHDELLKLLESDANRHTALAVVDYVDAYYQVALNRFIDDASIQVIETNLVAGLERVFDPLTVATMPSSQVAQIAGETPQRAKTREELLSQLRILKTGMQTCEKHRKPQLPGMNEDVWSNDDFPEVPDAQSNGSQEIAGGMQQAVSHESPHLLVPDEHSVTPPEETQRMIEGSGNCELHFRDLEMSEENPPDLSVEQDSEPDSSVSVKRMTKKEKMRRRKKAQKSRDEELLLPWPGSG